MFLTRRVWRQIMLPLAALLCLMAALGCTPPLRSTATVTPIAATAPTVSPPTATAPNATATAEPANVPALTTMPSPVVSATVLVPTAPPADSAGPTAAPTPGPLGMVCGDESGVFWIDPASGELLPLLGAPLGDAWALHDSFLAFVRGRLVELVDLAIGKTTMLTTDMPVDLAEAQVIWSDDAGTLLLAGWIEPDPDADDPQQQVVFQELAPDGAPGTAVRYDGPPAMLLGYDATAHQALVWRATGQGDGIEVLSVDLATGQTGVAIRFEAISEVTLGANGSIAALGGARQGYEIIIVGGPDTAGASLTLPAGTYATQLTWSPDGAKLAYLLHRGELYDPEAELLGVYVYALATGEGSGPLSLSPSELQIAGWTHDGQSIIVRGQGAAGPYYAAIQPGAAGERLLFVRGAMTYVGWLPRPSLAPEAPALDVWRGRFAAAAGDAEATAAAAASFVAANPDLTLAERAARLAGYYAGAGWADRQRRLVQLVEGLYALEAPPANIVLADGGVAQIIGQGQTLADARLADDQLVIVYGGDYGGAKQWSATLLQQQQGQWQVVWQPLGQADWVTTDGDVAFDGTGLETLRVTGNSRGLPAAPFVECDTCPKRQLAATWRLADGAYVRETALPPDADAASVHWEMTTHTPYALVYEAVRRLRAGVSLGELTLPTAKAQLEQLELSAADLRLMVSGVTASSVTFGPAAAPDSYRATIMDGQITAVERLR